MVNHCCAIGCTNTSDLVKNIKFHSFPLSNPSLLEKWTKAVRRKDFKPTKSTKICSSHFIEDDYTAGRFLNLYAVPSIFNFEATNGRNTKKILASEEDIMLPEELINKEWDPLEELGLDSSQVELEFEDEVLSEPKLVDLSNVSCREIGTQTFIKNKCEECENYRHQLRLLHKQIERRDNKIVKMQELINNFKDQIAESKKRKIKIMGNSIILQNNQDEQYTVVSD